MMAAKIGSDRAHRNVVVETGGSSRSARRSIRGPEPSRGAAMRVLRGAACRLEKAFTPHGRNRGLGNILVLVHNGSWMCRHLM